MEEKEHSHLEHLVGDISNLDTARMTLRWALERLNAVEKTARELEEKHAKASEAARSLERRLGEAQTSLDEKTRKLRDAVAINEKLETSLQSLAQGRVDFPAVAKKEHELDKLRRDLLLQHEQQVAELEHTHREMVARWTDRLSKVDSYNPEKLAETMAKYDEFRKALEQKYQERLLALEQAFHRKEQEFAKREREWETDYQRRLQDLENFRVQLQTQSHEQSRTWDASYSKLRESLLAELDQRRRDLELEFQTRGEQAAAELETLKHKLHEEQLRRWGKVRQGTDEEHERLLVEQKDLMERLAQEQRRLGEVEQMMAQADQKRQEEKLQWLATIEQAYEEKTKEIERAQAEARADLEEKKRSLETEYAQAREDLELSFSEKGSLHERELDDVRRSLRADWEIERKRLADELEHRDRELRRVENEMAALRETVEREKSDHAAHWEQERSRLEATILGLREESEVIKSSLMSRLEEALQAREREEGQRLKALELAWHSERDRMQEENRRALEDVTARAQTLEDDLKSSRAAVSSAAAKAARVQEELRTTLTVDFEEALKRRETAEMERAAAQEGKWQAERKRLEDTISELQSQLEQTRRALASAASAAQLAQEALRVQVAQQFEASFKEREDILYAQLRQARSALAGQAAEAQSAQEAMRLKLIAEFEATLAAREKSENERLKAREQAEAEKLSRLDEKWKREREALEKRVLERSQLDIDSASEAIKKLQEQLSEARSQLLASTADLETSQELLRVKLTEQFQEVLRQRDQSEAARVRAVEDRWNAERQNLLKEIAMRDQDLAGVRNELSALRQLYSNAAAEVQNQMDELRSKVSAEFQKEIDRRQQGFHEERARLVEAYDQARHQMEERLERQRHEETAARQTAAVVIRREAEAQARAAAEAEFQKLDKELENRAERIGHLETLLQQARQEQQRILSACEQYLKRLEAKEQTQDRPKDDPS